MKNMQRTLLLIVSGLLVLSLSGCFGSEEGTVTPSEVPTGDEAVEEMVVEGEAVIENSEEPLENEELPEDFEEDRPEKEIIADATADEDARQSLDLKRCKDIDNADDRWNCLEFTVVAIARNSTDAAICNELKENESAKTSCLGQLGTGIIEFPEQVEPEYPVEEEV
jgi:hypothetical protein